MIRSIQQKEMIVKAEKTRLVVVAMIALFAVSACDFFKSSGPEGGVSPFISDMSISSNSITCGRNFVVRFSYQDPQNDIEFMRITFVHEEGSGFEQEVLWVQGGAIFGIEDLELTEEELAELTVGSLDLSIAGRAAYTYAFECDTGLPRGTWTVSVQLVDDNGHEGNTRMDTINLSSN